MLLTKEVAKAGRALIGWTQQDLADRSGLSIGTIQRFETGGSMYGDNAERMIQALTDGGIIFISRADVFTGVRKRRPSWRPPDKPKRQRKSTGPYKTKATKEKTDV